MTDCTMHRIGKNCSCKGKCIGYLPEKLQTHSRNHPLKSSRLGCSKPGKDLCQDPATIKPEEDFSAQGIFS